jgi:glycosyltransferase involved in cell wall biosynthesis
MKPSVLFITRICFLDAALEYINEVKKYVDLSVIIEIDPYSKNKNICNIDKLPTKITFIDAVKLLNPTDYENFKPYIKGCNSFEFLVHQKNKSISTLNIKKSYLLYKKTKKESPNFIHFDDVSIRLLPFTFLFYLLKTKLIINVHDPIQHTGEKNIKTFLTKRLFHSNVYKYVTFSKYSKKILLEKKGENTICINLKLKPYNFYSNYLKKNENEPIYISFIGRVSEYKGIDIFLESITILNRKYPDVKYIIAGAPYNNTIGSKLTNKYKFKNVDFKLNHLSNFEVCEIIQNSKIIVCPYRDATQSGVVMTSLALHTPVIVSNQGGLPEYIQHNITGMIANADAESFAIAIETFIIDSFKNKQLSLNIKNIDLNQLMFGENKILNLYA